MAMQDLEEIDRDEVLVLRINEWLNNDILPEDYQHLSNWDIFESLHDDNISIVHIASTLYNHRNEEKNDQISEFLQDDDDDDEDEDDDIKQRHDKNSNHNTFTVQVEKMHQFRIVFDFTGFAFDENSKTSKSPPVLAIYKKNEDNSEWQQIFKHDRFDDNEIHSICMNEGALDDEDDDMEQCDLSLLFGSMSTQQLIHGIKAFLKKRKQTDAPRAQLLTRKITELQRLQQLAMYDKDFLTVIIAKMVAIDGEDILHEFNALIDDEVDELFNTQFKQNMATLKTEVNESNFVAVLDDIEQMVKTAQSLHHRKQTEIALDLLQTICQQFLIDFIVRLHEEEDDDYIELDVQHHSKLNYRIGDIENALEKVCGDVRDKDVLEKLQFNVKQWQKQLLRIFGPLFSDNIRSIEMKLKEMQHEPKDESNNHKKRKLTGSSESNVSNKRRRRE